MLTIEEIRLFIDEDLASQRKLQARTGMRYYDAEHDIKDCRLFFYNSDGQLVEDTTRANVKIPHPFFTELVEQAAQYILSGDEAFVLMILTFRNSLISDSTTMMNSKRNLLM